MCIRDRTYTFVEKEKQQASLKFLMDEVLTYPKWLFDTEVGQYTYLLRNTPIGKQENAPTQILDVYKRQSPIIKS